jgi:FtsH-binding integral membrane protein
MADLNPFQQAQTSAAPSVAEQAQLDQGLRSYMLGIYNYMTIAMVITGGVAMGLANFLVAGSPAEAVAVMQNGVHLTQLGATIFGSPLQWVVMFAPLAFVMVLSFGINKLSASAARMIFFVYAAVMGVSLSSIFLIYSGASIAQTFFVTAAAFGGLSLYGYTTKRSLSGMGSFLLMGLIGLIVAMVVNIFLQSGMLMFAINAIGVLIFSGLVAYDTQRLKHMYDAVSHSGELMAKTSIMGALSLYLNFVNLFMFLLSFLGNRN